MVLDLSSLLSGKCNRLDFEYEIKNQIESECMDEAEGEAEDAIIPPDDVSFTAPVRVKGYITDNAGYMNLCANAEIDYK